MNGPIRSGQILNFAEVAVSGHKDHSVTFRRGGDPDVVLGKEPPFLLQVLFKSPVFPGNIEIGGDNGPAGCESLHPGSVLRRPARLRGLRTKTAEAEARAEMRCRA